MAVSVEQAAFISLSPGLRFIHFKPSSPVLLADPEALLDGGRITDSKHSMPVSVQAWSW